MKEKVTIIAEAGVNHNGDLLQAKKLIKVAANSGADYIKFQTFKTDLNISKTASKADYQVQNTGNEETQYEMIKKLELSYNDFQEIKAECEKNDIGFLTTAFDFPSLDFLESLKPDFYKIPSGEITNLPYLQKVASFGRKVIMSTGMASMDEVKDAFKVLLNSGLSKDKITVVHCNTEYPTPMEDVNLKAMNAIGEELGVKVGYSDHTLGIEVPIAAVALGATVIEKHFTLDRTLPGPDQKASLEPEELISMVQGIRNIEKAIMGSGRKEPSVSEKKNKPIARKSIVAATNIRKGDTFNENNLAVKRPGTGISPMEWYEVLGKEAQKDFEEDQIISLS